MQCYFNITILMIDNVVLDIYEKCLYDKNNGSLHIFFNKYTIWVTKNVMIYSLKPWTKTFPVFYTLPKPFIRQK